LVVFGIGMLINHREPPSLYHYWAEDEPSHSSESYWTPSTMSSSVVYETLKDIQKGEELFISYGGDDWFHDRSIPLVKNNESDTNQTETPVLVPDAFLQQHGHCLTDVFISDSEKPMTFYGLFARRHFKKGEIVTISPLLALPADEVERVQDESLIQNYCFASPGSKVAMLPIGYAAMINDDAHPNVEMDWYTWPQVSPLDATNTTTEKDQPAGEGLDKDNLQKCLESDPSELIYEANYSIMDLKFVATRDIFPEEEITMDYGVAWLNKWAEYMSASMSYHANEEASLDRNIIFRSFIEPPKGLFPERWNYYDEPELYDRSDEVDEVSGLHLNDARAALEGLTDFYMSREEL
jgi:hypothetical protein